MEQTGQRIACRASFVDDVFDCGLELLQFGAELCVVGGRDVIDGNVAVEADGDMIVELVNVDADVEFVVSGEVNLVEELMFF